MNESTKGRLLARIEGQLAFVEGHPERSELHERRVDEALSQLQKLLGHGERRRYERMATLLARSRDDRQAMSTRAHWRMLVRADCLVWQMRLRHEQPAHEAAA